MLRSLYLKTIRDQRRGLMWWGIGIVSLAVWTLGWYRSFIGKIPDMSRFLDRAPAGLKAFFGGSFDLASPAGYLRTELFAFMAPLLLTIFAVGKGASTIAGEEGTGSLDLLLAAPISRRRVVLEKLGAVVTSTLLLSAGLAVALLIGIVLTGLEIRLVNVLAASIVAGLLAALFGSVALSVGAATGRKGAALGIAAAIGVGGYLLYGLSASVHALLVWRWAVPFTYYAQADILRNGANLVHVAVLAGWTVCIAMTGVILFERRDLRT